MKEKLEFINKVKSGATKASISREYGIPEGTIRGWMNDEIKLTKFVNELDDNSTLKRKKVRLGNHVILDKYLYKWFIEKKKNGEHVTGPMLMSQAEQIHNTLNLEGKFKASHGWLWRFRRRHGISQNSTHEDEINKEDTKNESNFHDLLSIYIKEEGQNEIYIKEEGHTEIYDDNETEFYPAEDEVERNEESNIINEVEIPTTKDALNALEIVYKWTELQKDIDRTKLQNLECLKQDMLHSLAESKQTRITDFFK